MTAWTRISTFKLYLFALVSVSVPAVAGPTLTIASSTPSAHVLCLRCAFPVVDQRVYPSVKHAAVRFLLQMRHALFDAECDGWLASLAPHHTVSYTSLHSAGTLICPQSITNGCAHTAQEVLACSARLLLLMASSMLFYLLTAQSCYVRENAFGRYLSTFRVFFISVLATLLLDIICGTTAVALTRQAAQSDVLLRSDGYQVVNGVCQMAYGLNLACAAWSVVHALDRRHWQLQRLLT